ncbi:MAG TPA: hypothetical protein VH157_06890 [Bryobacteraceae bacterium]|jgi:hypothetical protein|nr:hypothetical protein [Bryobacteraceae bacterium]
MPWQYNEPEDPQPAKDLETFEFPPSLADISPDVPMDDASVTCWNGTAFVTWEKWRGAKPLARIDPKDQPWEPDPGIKRWAATCGPVDIHVFREEEKEDRLERWLMHVRPAHRSYFERRKDFASISARHSIETAELWYGKAQDGWKPY